MAPSPNRSIAVSPLLQLTAASCCCVIVSVMTCQANPSMSKRRADQITEGDMTRAELDPKVLTVSATISAVHVISPNVGPATDLRTFCWSLLMIRVHCNKIDEFCFAFLSHGQSRDPFALILRPLHSKPMYMTWASTFCCMARV